MPLKTASIKQLANDQESPIQSDLKAPSSKGPSLSPGKQILNEKEDARWSKKEKEELDRLHRM